MQRTSVTAWILSYTHTKRQAAAAAARSHWNALWRSKMGPRSIFKRQGERHHVHMNPMYSMETIWRCRLKLGVGISLGWYFYPAYSTWIFQSIRNRVCISAQSAKIWSCTVCAYYILSYVLQSLVMRMIQSWSISIRINCDLVPCYVAY